MRVYLTLDKGKLIIYASLVSETLETKIQLSEDGYVWYVC